MSSFLVDDKTINKIVNMLSYHARSSEWLKNEMKPLDLYTSGWQEKLAQQMLDLNYRALSARYGDKDNTHEIDYLISDTGSMVEVYKALRSWLYQCAEGNIHTTELYKLMDKVYQPYLAHEIINALPEYENADWY